MAEFTFEVLQDGNIEICRELCNELMAFQKSKAYIAPEVFDLMNFDTRMKPSYESAANSHVVVVRHDAEAVGYIFSTIENTETGDKSALPMWLPQGIRKSIMDSGGKFNGFYPDWERLPQKCGCLNHLYLKDICRGSGVGGRLCRMAMEWFMAFPVEVVFVYISNGNDEALDFYKKLGFKYSHEVFGGFIKAAYYRF